jgi:hypothetical protein
MQACDLSLAFSTAQSFAGISFSQIGLAAIDRSAQCDSLYVLLIYMLMRLVVLRRK